MTTPAERRFDLAIGDQTIAVRCRRSARARRLSLRLAADGDGAVLTVPAKTSWSDARAFAEDHRGWLRDHLAALPPRVPFADGACLPVLGMSCTVRHRPDQLVLVTRVDDELRVGGHPAHLAARVGAWLKDLARDVLGDACRDKAAQVGQAVARVSVRDTRSRWGSCSSRGSISLSWRLILAPPSVTDYVVAHEVAHLAYMDHGPRFWRQVSRLCHDYKTARAWLRDNGPTLHRYG